MIEVSVGLDVNLSSPVMTISRFLFDKTRTKISKTINSNTKIFNFDVHICTQ